MMTNTGQSQSRLTVVESEQWPLASKHATGSERLFVATARCRTRVVDFRGLMHLVPT